MFLLPGARARTRPGSFPSGTLMLFQQTAAPLGWTKQTTHNDKALRVVSGAASSGGSSAFSTAFSAGATTANHTLVVGEVPNLTVPGLSVPGLSIPALNLNTQGVSGASAGNVGIKTDSGGTNIVTITAGGGTTGGGTTGSGTTTGGGGAGHSHTLSINVQFVDLIIAKKV